MRFPAVLAVLTPVLPCLALVLAAGGAGALFHEPSMAALAPPRALPPDSFFGYSITYDSKNKHLVSSAPRADNIGQVFSCDVAARTCSRLTVMPDKDILLRPQKYSNHSFWLGATVKADASNLLICAPRHTDKMLMPNGFMHFATYGSCYAKKLAGPVDGRFELLPKIRLEERQKNVEHNERLTDSFGWSIDFAADSHVRVGGAAMYTGRVMTYDLNNLSVAPSLLYGDASKSKVNFNFGYSIASGYYFSTSLSFAVSTPYGDIGKGKVIFFENNKYKWAIVDDEVGSLFGATLCSAKLTASRTSVLIGAPAYFHFDGNKDRYHTGMVYVYVPNKSELSLAKKIEGPKDGGFFGYSIANVGDMDRDGMDEIVIAAPYEDDGAGAVYLFSGATLVYGDAPRWLQRLQPEGFRSFGLSMTAFNYSDNGCKDLAIGAPGNDRVAVYHCLAFVSVKVEAIFPDVQKRSDKTSFEFTFCLNANLPEKPRVIGASFNVTVKIKHPNASLAANPTGDFIVMKYTIDRGNPRVCQKIKVITKDGDYERPIRFDIRAAMVDDPSLSKNFDPSKATVGPGSSLTITSYVSAAECRGETCAPKLSVDVESSLNETYVTGSTETEWVRVVVRNNGSDAAYLPCARTQVAAPAALARAPPACAWAGSQERICTLQGALRSNKVWNISEAGPLLLDMTSLTSASAALRVRVALFARCGDAAPAQTWARDVTLRHDNSGVRIHGKTDQGEEINVTKADIEIGKRIQHTYTIVNTQGTNWEGLVCKIWLKKEPYVEFGFPIQMYRGDAPAPPCAPDARRDGDGSYTLRCAIGRLFRKDTVTIVVPIYIPPGKLVNIYETLNATVQTSITLQFDEKAEDIKQKVETTLLLQQAVVPLWVILVALGLGVLLVLLIAFALYECGCLRRKNKELLKNLKTEVKRKSKILHRQSMRLSDSARESLRNKTYRELLDLAEAQEAEEGCFDDRNQLDHLDTSGQPEADQATSSMSDKRNIVENSLKTQRLKQQ